MSNPWSRASPVTWPFGPGQGTDNFSGLPNGQAKGLNYISPSSPNSPFGDIILPPWKITLAAAPVAGNVIQRYMLFSEYTNLWPGNIDPTSTSDQSVALAAWIAADPQVASQALIDQLVMQTGQTLYTTRWVTLRGLVGNVPTYAAVIFYNNSGANLATFSVGPPANQIAAYAAETYV